MSLRCQPCSVEEALELLDAQVPCSFSYQSETLADRVITIALTNVSLRDAVVKVTGNQFEIGEHGRHLVLTEKQASQATKSKKHPYLIEGYVRNAQTGQVLQHATVYAVENKYIALTNSSGFYRIELNTDADEIGLSISKQSFFDTVVVVSATPQAQRRDIALLPREEAPKPMATLTPQLPPRITEVEQLPMVKALVPEKQSGLAINFDFLTKIPVQFSLTPSLGTNKLTSGVSDNLLSINVLAGYNAGVRGLELGGGVNIVRKNVNGLQSAGLANIVGGEVRGIQGAGLFNNVRGSIHGLQAAGVYNIVLDTVVGCQAAGVFNVLNGTISGAQLSGVFNVATENMRGLQGAGVANITRGALHVSQVAGVANAAGSVKGLQAAGILNFALDSVSGSQISGVANFVIGPMSGMQIAGALNATTSQMNGVQLAGVANVARNVNGGQFAGVANFGADVNRQVSAVLNVGRRVEGMQLALVNISDSAARSFGLLSFSRKGVNSLEVFTDEVQAFNMAYRTGSKVFYNIVQVGYGSLWGPPLLSYGYGIGTDIGKPANRWHMHLEWITRQLHNTERDAGLQLTTMLAPHLAFRVGKKRPALVLGPTFNLHFRTEQLQGAEALDSLSQYVGVFTPFSGSFEVNGWAGGKLGIRF